MNLSGLSKAKVVAGIVVLNLIVAAILYFAVFPLVVPGDTAFPLRSLPAYSAISSPPASSCSRFFPLPGRWLSCTCCPGRADSRRRRTPFVSR